MTLPESLIALGVGGVILAAVATLFSYHARSCAAIANYVDLDASSRNALDRMTRDIRQANRLLHFSATDLTFEMVDTNTGALNTLAYVYNPQTATLVRTFAGTSTLLLKQIAPNTLKFSMFQRNPLGGPVDQYPTTNASLCKVVQLSWICSRDILGGTHNSESVQSAKVVIRKE